MEQTVFLIATFAPNPWTQIAVLIEKLRKGAIPKILNIFTANLSNGNIICVSPLHLAVDAGLSYLKNTGINSVIYASK